MTFNVKAFRISAANDGSCISVVTLSSKHPQSQDALRMPLVEHRFAKWPSPQPYVHDCDVVFHGLRFRLFFQRHKLLPKNSAFNFKGDLVIMRLGKKNPENVVNLRAGDVRLARQIGRR